MTHRARSVIWWEDDCSGPFQGWTDDWVPIPDLPTVQFREEISDDS